MKLDDQWVSALRGETFSSGQSFLVRSEGARVPTRFDLARELAVGRSVLHVGCVDHVPLLDEKLAAGTWMHDVLAGAATRLGGIDVNAEGIELLRERGYADLHVGDVSRPSPELAKDHWDVLFLGEMLEHHDDPVGFLSRIRERWSHVGNVVVTVPNAFAWSTLRRTLRSEELINTDHRFWFTPFTIAKVAVRAGFSVDELHMCESSAPQAGAPLPGRVKQGVLRFALARRPIYRSCIVVVLSP